MRVTLIFSLLLTTLENSSRGNESTRYEIDGVRYEIAADGEFCLMQNDIKAIAFAGEDRLVFRTKDRFYINETQNECRAEDVVETKIALVSKGPRICRNDRVRLKGYGRQGPPRECTLSEFFELMRVE